MQWKDLYYICHSRHFDIAVIMAVQDVSAQAGFGSCADAREVPMMSDMCLYYFCCVNKEKTD